jgi:subfamily B ATP-binding cassette protein HlyB/CyaB
MQMIGILTPVMTQVVVDRVLSQNSLATLYTITVGILIAYLYELIISLAKNYLFSHTTNRIDVLLSHRLFKHLFSLPLRYFEARRVGETIARVRELDSIRSFLTGAPLSTVIDLIFTTVYIVVLFAYSKSLTMLVIGFIPLFALLSLIVTPLFKKRLDEQFRAGAETQSFLVEAVSGIQTVKSFSLEPEFERKWGDLQSDYVKAGYRTAMVSSAAGTVGTFIQRLLDLLILFFGARAVMEGTFTIGQLVAFRMLSGRVSGPILRLVQLWQEYQQASLSVRRIGDIFNAPSEQASGMSLTTAQTLQGRILFDKVRFRYRADTSEVIKNMSFEIPAGSIVGVVGRSGSGKSTLSKLIQRLYIPEGGRITVDGMDISMLDPAHLRRQIGVVLQENFMFNGTVRDNISIHMQNASTEDVLDAARIAGAHDFILELQNGYDTVIGEKGVSLSGGQKQRIAIARAIIGNPRILIFDEATSALDYESESIIQHNLKEICRGRTVLIIAHRLSTLKDVNRIIVLDHGNLMEYDTPGQLMKQQGLYYYLYNQQQRGEVE